MSQAIPSTAVQHAKAPEGHSGVDENAALDLLKNVNRAVHRAMERKADSQTTSVPDQDLGNGGPLMLADPEEDGMIHPRVLDFPHPPAYRSSSPTLHALQEWEGYVVEIGEDEFVANLLDLTAGARYADEEATIPLEEISENDARKMREGDIFSWVIGYERSASGTKRRVSQIVFRDMPRMTAADFEEGRKWAKKMARALNP